MSSFVFDYLEKVKPKNKTEVLSGLSAMLVIPLQGTDLFSIQNNVRIYTVKKDMKCSGIPRYYTK